MSQNILVAGVGGQGSILASHLLASAAIKAGLKVRVGETFGAAVRGGSVFSHVKIEKGESPLIGEYKAGLILSLEPLEGFRAAVQFLVKGGWLISNIRPRYPVEVSIGHTQYLSINEIQLAISEINGRCLFLDAADLAEQAGNVRTMNVVMLGTMCSAVDLGINKEYFQQAIMRTVPKRTVEVNLKAFDLGWNKGNLLVGKT